MSGCARTNLTKEQIIRGQPYHLGGIDSLLGKLRDIAKSLPAIDFCPQCYRPMTLERTDFAWKAEVEMEFFYLPFLPAYTCDRCGETYLADPIHDLALRSIQECIKDLELPVTIESSAYRLRPTQKVEA